MSDASTGRSSPPEPDPVAGAQPVPDPFAVVADAVDGMREELATLNDQFRRRLLTDRESRLGLDELRGQLEHARQSAEGRTVLPLLYDLILLLDRVERHPEVTGGFADSVATELLTLLEKYGMTRIRLVPGAFDPAEQEAVGSIAAPSPEQHGEVAELVRHGYRMAGRIVRPLQVRVYTSP